MSHSGKNTLPKNIQQVSNRAKKKKSRLLDFDPKYIGPPYFNPLKLLKCMIF